MSYIPKPNAGLYTGEPFHKGAAWAPVPCIPETDALLKHMEETSYFPMPPGARYQFPGETRPGNNYQDRKGVVYRADLGQYCIDDNAK